MFTCQNWKESLKNLSDKLKKLPNHIPQRKLGGKKTQMSISADVFL